MARKVAKWILRVFLALLLLVILLAWGMYGRFIQAARSVTMLEDGLYYMEIKGDYGLDNMMNEGGVDSDEALANYLIKYLSHGFAAMDMEPVQGTFGCSAVMTRTADGQVYYGRNYDWAPCKAMIVHTKPKNGYESYATCCLDFLGFGDDYRPDGDMSQRMMSMAAIYVVLDGMNSEGLMVADLMAGDAEVTKQNTDKDDVTTTTAIRLMLDRCANVEEALELLESYDMNSSIGAAHHFAIADKTGRSVVVEYVDNEMYVKDTNVVTNHYLTDCGKNGVGSEQSHIRFETLSNYDGPSGETEVRDLLKSVAQFNFPQKVYEKTMWSVVYNPSENQLQYYFAENYDNSYGFLIGE